MSVTQLRPLGVGEILDVAITIYRRNFRTLLTLVFVVVAPFEHRGSTIIAEVPGPAGYRAEDLVGIEFAADHVYLFAAADGRNLEVPS